MNNLIIVAIFGFIFLFNSNILDLARKIFLRIYWKTKTHGNRMSLKCSAV